MGEGYVFTGVCLFIGGCGIGKVGVVGRHPRISRHAVPRSVRILLECILFSELGPEGNASFASTQHLNSETDITFLKSALWNFKQ